MNNPSIRIFGARQNNLKNLNVDFKTHEITVVTGVSGSGKSSLVFDTLYAEGQRRYVETFSPYARQFLDRMDRPNVDRIEGVPPAIAIDQTNPVRTSRSTVGTMTELNDHLKLIFAHAAKLYCACCAHPIQTHTPAQIEQALTAKAARHQDPRLIITFKLSAPNTWTEQDVLATLSSQGFTRIHRQQKFQQETIFDVVVDRFRAGKAEPERRLEAVETALRLGKGAMTVFVQTPEKEQEELLWHYFESLTCPHCQQNYDSANAASFSFNSPVGACPHCKGFGRIIGVDYDLVIPNTSLTLAEGAVKPWMTKTNELCMKEMAHYAQRDGIRLNVPYRDLSEREKDWVINGQPDWDGHWRTQWYGIKHFFEWLESKAYKMHVRVLLSRYRNYRECPHCHSARLKDQWLLWRLGNTEAACQATEGLHFKRHCPDSAHYDEATLNALPGLNLYDLMRLPLNRLQRFFTAMKEQAGDDSALQLLLDQILIRLDYLVQVGLGYLCLDRQSRTLSGGEVQRINLTTALGTSLTKTLFVLDEPSIGLHPQDMDQINQILKRLRDAGNTLVIVEHDPQVMLAADRILDMGPGPGQQGGQIVFDGTPRQLMKSDTLTGRYLSGAKRINMYVKKRLIDEKTPFLSLFGARENNLKNLSVHFPIGKLSVVSGVSGSGKSTLIENILVPAVLKAKGKPTEAPGLFDRIDGLDFFDELYFVDQSPIGKTTRSTPVSYVGAFDSIRQLFAKTDSAKAYGYTAGTFSFNQGEGRCPRCSGNGFEHIEMQFLSDVYLRCPDCNGSRYRPDVLQVTITRHDKTLNIAQVLDLTVEQACEFFDQDKAVISKLQPLQKVGLNYITLGQAVPTLSGGEAQRLKIAGYLAQKISETQRGHLFILDEPTTGLHFDDIAKLMLALQELVDRGNSVIVIEHNLDVINSADWIIDLGPQGGENGGNLLFEGPLTELLRQSQSATARALKSYRSALNLEHCNAYFTSEAPKEKITNVIEDDCIDIQGAREHNLKNIHVQINHNEFTVITGVSGSGKSTLAFDIVFKEGQRRYLETLNAYARNIVQPPSKPDVDSICGMAPTVAIEQRTSRGGQKSTVATMTEIYHFLRLLFVKLGTQYCPNCHVPVRPQSFEQIFADILKRYDQKSICALAPLVIQRKGIYNDLAKWAHKKGYPHLRVDQKIVSTDPFPKLARYKEHTIELPIAEVVVGLQQEQELKRILQEALLLGKGVLHILQNDTQEVQVFSTLRSCPSCAKSFPALDPRLFSYNSAMGWCPTCFGTGRIIEGFDESASGEERQWEERHQDICPDCHGMRLNPIALNVEFAQRNIQQITALTVQDALDFFNSLQLDPRQSQIAHDALLEIHLRLSFLSKVGLNYLTLDRSAPTLSGGEAQRIRLASQLGTNLQGVCYILDEPTIGLHPRDNQRLIDSLKVLVKKGNTLIVVEHDEDTIREADKVIDIGPGAGVRGGQVIAEGTISELIKHPQSITGQYLRHPIRHSFTSKPIAPESTDWLRILRPQLHNLKTPSIDIPLNRLTVLTGVSGSGKSSLTRGVLLPVLKESLKQHAEQTLNLCQAIQGWQHIDRVLEVDQTPIGKTPRSCPATYVGFMDALRKLYAATPQAQMLGYSISRFSFNTKGGRCEVCEGQGVRTVEMNFLPDVKLPCEACHGQRFNDATLQVKWKNYSIGDVLMMDVDEACEVFAAQSNIARALSLMQDVGLGYLSLGQPSHTLSGGEAQRIKLVTELIKCADDCTRRGAKSPKTLYILDEPTVGLHMADVEKLIAVLHRLIQAGNSVIVIEHNLDIIAEADWIIDMGPEGGDQGGQVVACGPLDEIIRANTYTGKALAQFKKQHLQK